MHLSRLFRMHFDPLALDMHHPELRATPRGYSVPGTRWLENQDYVEAVELRLRLPGFDSRVGSDSW